MPNVTLRAARLRRLLGVDIEPREIRAALKSLAMTVARGPTAAAAGADSVLWQVQPPSWRFDIAIEADLIEEVARLGGLDTIAEAQAPLPARAAAHAGSAAHR